MAKQLNSKKYSVMEGLKILNVAFVPVGSQFCCKQANTFRGGNGKAIVLQYSVGDHNPISQVAHTTCNLVESPFYQTHN